MLVNNIKNISESTAYKKVRAVLSCLFHYIHKKSFWGIFKKIDEKFFKFLFVGAINTLFSYLVYSLFIFTGLNANISLFFQYIICVLWNFKTTGSIVFKNNNNKLIFKFIASYILTFFINSFCLYMLTKVFNDYISQAILVFPIAMLSFLIMKFWVFKQK